MDKDSKDKIKNYPLKERQVIYILLFVSLLMAVTLPLFNIFGMLPYFTDILIKQLEDESISWGEHMRKMFFSEATQITAASLPKDFSKTIDYHRKDFGLDKVKVFSDSGEVIYSSDPKDVGNVNKENYFQKIVSQGKPYIKIIEKGGATLESQYTGVDVVETYVPIMHGSRFIGAFEIYRDISSQKEKIGAFRGGTSFCLSIASLIFLGSIIMLSLIAKKSLSKHRRALDDLEESREKFRHLAETTKVVPWEFDIKRNVFSYIGPQAKDFFGYPCEHWTDFDSWAELIHPEDRKWAVDFCLSATQRGEDHEFEYRIVKAEGEIVWVRDIVTVISELGEGHKLRGFMFDVTKRKIIENELNKYRDHLEDMVSGRTNELLRMNRKLETEIAERKQMFELMTKSESRYKKLYQEFNALLDAIPDVLLLISPELKVVWANKASAIYLNKDISDLIGQTCYKLWFDRDTQCDDCYAMRSFNTGKIEQSQVITPDGKMWEVKAFPVKDAKEGIKNVILVGRDITEKKRIEEELMRTEKLETIGMLSGGVAHDFNNILASLSFKIATAQMSADPGGKVFEKLNEMKDILFTAKLLPRQLLTFSKGGLPIKKTVSVTSILNTAADIAISGSCSNCEFHVSEDILTVEADEGQMVQAFNNIFINAVNAMPDGGVITVNAENFSAVNNGFPTLKNGEYVKVSIKDEGRGIPEQHMQKIFEPFFTTTKNGHGLGLAIAHSVIKKHGGYIDVESNVGAGTVFHIYLPASRKGLETWESRSEFDVRNDWKILVMDDDDKVREGVCELLRHHGYNVKETKDGKEMLEAYKDAMNARPFDAVVMDLIVRGGMGGITAIKDLIEIDPDAKAILTSGYFKEPVLADFRRYGFSGVIAKPFEIGELETLLNNVITKRG